MAKRSPLPIDVLVGQNIRICRLQKELSQGELGRRIGCKLAAATGPTALFVPLRGVSMIAVAGQPFYDPVADAGLLSGLRQTIDGVCQLLRSRPPRKDSTSVPVCHRKFLRFCWAMPIACARY